MIALTKVLLEKEMSQKAIDMALSSEQGKKAIKDLADQQAMYPNRFQPAPVVVQPAPMIPAPITPVIRQPVLTSGYRQNLRQSFNSFPGGGKNLRVAGTGQPLPPTVADQQTFDTRFKQVAAGNRNLNPAGIPVVKPAPVPAPVQLPPPPPPVAHVHPDVTPVQGELPANTIPAPPPAVPSAPDISGTEAAGIAVKKGSEAAGEAAGSAAKKAMEFAGEHPAAAGLIAGAAGALGLRKILNRNKTV